MKVGIVGLGLIGGSFALAVRARREDVLLVSDTDQGTLRQAFRLGLVDGLLDRRSLAEVDLLLIALYPAAAISWLRENADAIGKGATVVDCAGIKREICAVGAELAHRFGFCFVGGHPMAGRETWGLSSASAELFSGASMILTPPSETDPERLSRLRAFFLGVGFGSVTLCTPKDHDRIIAYTSQLAHVLSSAYIGSPTAMEHRGFSAGSFRDMTRVAAINAEMWSEIMVSNRDHLLSELDRLTDSLSDFRRTIAGGDTAALADMLRRGAERKRESDLR